MQKPIVFISHITEEKEIASSLKKLVENTFLNMIDVFVSSDPSSIKMGKRWLDEITIALKSCAIEIVLASPKSVSRPWINFEAGSGWIREIQVIPLCHSGMKPGRLPAPLNSLQGAIATEKSDLERIFPVLAAAVGSGLPSAVNYQEFISTVLSFENDSKIIASHNEKNKIEDDTNLHAHEKSVIIEIANKITDPDDGIPIWGIKQDILKQGEFNSLAISLAFKTLSRKSFIEIYTDSNNDSYNQEFKAVKIREEGWEWFEENKNNLDLRGAVARRRGYDPGDELPF